MNVSVRNLRAADVLMDVEAWGESLLRILDALPHVTRQQVLDEVQARDEDRALDMPSSVRSAASWFCGAMNYWEDFCRARTRHVFYLGRLTIQGSALRCIVRCPEDRPMVLAACEAYLELIRSQVEPLLPERGREPVAGEWDALYREGKDAISLAELHREDLRKDLEYQLLYWRLSTAQDIRDAEAAKETRQRLLHPRFQPHGAIEVAADEEMWRLRWDTEARGRQ